MSLKSTLLLFNLLTGLIVTAQDIPFNGRIISDDNQPVFNASIRIMGSDVITESDRFGNFEVSVSINSVLTISKEGYSTYQLTVNNSTKVTIRLYRAYQVSIGYQEVPKNDLTSAIASVPGKDFNVGVINSPEQLFQSKATGAQVTVGSGEPGSMVYTFIRGLSSIQGNTPLFVVDGFPLSNHDVYAGSTNFGRGTSLSRDPLNFINPSDVERIDILKDASSTAIYGSRGNHGVVLIKTKNGAYQNQLQFTSQISLSNQSKYFELLNSDQFLSGIEDLGGDPIALDYGGDTDWQKEINQSSITQKYDLTYSDTYKAGYYTVSLGYEDQPGIIKESSLNKIMGRINWNHSLFNNRLQIMGHLSASSLRDSYSLITTNAGFQGDLLGSVIAANPTWQNDPNIQPFTSTLNPLSLLKYHEDNSKTNRVLVNFSLNYAVTANLSVRVNAGMDRASSNREAALSPDLFFGNGVYDNGRASIKTRETDNDLFELALKYEKIFNTSRITVLVDYAYQEFSQDEVKTEGWGFSSSEFTNIINDLNSSANKIRNTITNNYEQYGYSDDSFFITQRYPSPTLVDLTPVKPAVSVRSVIEEFNKAEDKQQSFFGRVNYSILSKYFLMASIRADGSSLYGDNHEYGFFPAISAAWALSEERFTPSFFSNLKLRIGFGVSGSQNIPYHANKENAQWSSLSISSGGFIFPPVYSITSNDNPDLKWEETSEVNVGLDFEMFETKLQGTLDIYHKTTTDFLFLAPQAQPSVLPYVLLNAEGEIINKGAEVSLDYRVLDKKNTIVSLEVNIAYNTNTIRNFNGTLEAGPVFGAGLTNTYVQRIQEDQSMYSFFLREFKGFDTNGYSEYENGGSFKFVGQSLPKFVLGFGLNTQIKNWYAAIFFSGSTGHSIYNNTANAYFTAGSLANGRNVITPVLTNGETPFNEPDASTRFLEKGDFVRIQNATIGHNFFFDKRPFKSIHAYLSGQNLFVWTNYSGLDPDINVGKIGIDYSLYPKARTFTLGLQLTF